MLREVQNARQVPGEGFRRWFADSDFDLIVWYPDGDPSTPVEGFQLCYDKQGSERALTWRRGRGFAHEKVDDGESGRSVQSKMTPILVPDGVFDAAGVARRLREHCGGMDAAVAQFVLRAVTRYPTGE